LAWDSNSCVNVSKSHKGDKEGTYIKCVFLNPNSPIGVGACADDFVLEALLVEIDMIEIYRFDMLAGRCEVGK